jgi:putative FmdB family regulatory protein
MRYDYKCTKCNTTFEIEKGINEKKDKITCPICGSIKTVRIYNTVNIVNTKSNSQSTPTCPSGTCPFIS